MRNDPARPERFFRFLLKLFPFEFRRDYGREMTLLFRDQCRDAEGPMGWVRLWGETLADVFKTAPREHADMLRQDLDYALRTLAKNPGFTAVAILTLALGLGLNGAFFSLVDGVLLRPLPYPDEGRLVSLRTVHEEIGTSSAASLHDFADWRAESDAFSHMAVYSVRDGNLTGTGLAERIVCSLVSNDFFATLGVGPAAGRGFLAAEDLPGNDDVAVVSHAFWQSVMGGSPTALGSALTLDGERLQVVGIMPPGFDFPPGSGVGVWKPLGMTPEQSGRRDGRWIAAIARLAPGVSLAAARSKMDAVGHRLAEAWPETNAGWTVRLAPLRDRLVGYVRPALLLLWASVGVVLLIVCANLAHLLLARGTARRQEMALRAALGAGRSRLVRQLVTESLLLSCAGGLAGLAVAHAAITGLLRLAGGRIPRAEEIGLDARVAGFTFLLALLAGLLSGLYPAMRSSRSDLAGALQEAGRSGAVVGGGGARSLLVVAEVALAVVVLVAAGLVVRSFAGLLAVDPGFLAHGVLAVRVAPPWRADLDGDDAFERIQEDRLRAAGFYRELLTRVAAIPGVRSASAVNQRPLAGSDAWVSGIRSEGTPCAVEETPSANVRAVLPGYFETLGIPLHRGRFLAAGDDERTERVAVVSDALAEACWPGADPLGRRIALAEDPDGGSRVVGVVGDVHGARLERRPRPTLYWTFPQARWGHFMDWHMDLLARAEGDPLALLEPIRREVAALDRSLPVFSVLTMDDALRSDLAGRRFNLVLLAVFAACALLLTAVGIYGVLAFSVGRRVHEMGVRLALGASARRILGLVVRQGMTLVGAGLVLGLAAAAALTRSLDALVYGVSATDPATYVLAGLVLLLAGLLACVVPARRAMRVDPIRALRCD